MKQNSLNKLGLNLTQDWNVSDLINASRGGYLQGFTEDQLEKLNVLQEAITEYLIDMPIDDQVQITNADLATLYLYPVMKNLDHEECWILFLSRRNTIIKRMRLTSGGATQTVIDNKQILRNAILLGANGVIIAHSHPSGDPHPSRADTIATRALTTACESLDILLLDHIIIANTKYYSFTEKRTRPYHDTVLSALADYSTTARIGIP